MPIREARPFPFRPHGLTDAVDGTNALPGSMKTLQNLVCSPSTRNAFVPRPAGVQTVDMASKFTAPTNVPFQMVVGNKVYGWCSSADYPGKDVPFVYDLSASAFITISGLSSALLPATQATAGDWTPPSISVFSTACIIFTHPGFPGGSVMFGWLDTSGLTISSLTGTTASGSNVISAVSGDPYLAGVEPGMQIAGAGIPAGAYVLSTTSAPNTITISANATASSAGVALTITGGTAAAPLWGAGNTNTHGLASVPKACAQFNSRGYFGVGNAAVYSDALRPRQMSNASQVLILGDDQPVTALAATPLSAPITGGVLASLIAFKGAGAPYQITGDAATSNLAQNVIEGAVGTLAPMTITPTTRGLAYVAPDGVRYINPSGQCTDPMGFNGDGVCAPFVNVQYPSRMCAAFAHNTLRISLQDATLAGSPWVEYWYNFARDVWVGPHTGAATCLSNWADSALIDFVYVLQSDPAKLYQSSIYPQSASVFVENGAQLVWQWQNTLMPDNAEMAENQVVQTTMALNLLANQQITVSALNENGTALDVVTLQGATAAGLVWGAGNWGGASWAAATQMRQYSVPWSKPLVFKQMSVQAYGDSGAGILVGNLYASYQVLGYLIDPVQQQ